MPWNETDRMDERSKFVVAYCSGQYEMSELCSSFKISRPTGYKWLARYSQHGPPGLQDRSRAAHSCPHRMSEELSQWLLGERRAHPRWGARKLLTRHKRMFPYRVRPSRSAVAALLKRAGLIQPRRRRKRDVGRGAPVVRVYQPNDLWTIDFKGQFRMGNHRYCYPLTLMDYSARYLLGCHGQHEISTASVHMLMQRQFREHGLPRIIHSDNGTPFASNGIAGLSRLSVSWLKLGIQVHRSRPGHPQDNGAHERMHRTLKAETTRPPARHLSAQQHRFDAFRTEYNVERPHESLNDRSPAELYRRSARSYPQRIEPVHYPNHFEVRCVATNGTVRWHRHFLFIGMALVGECLGIEEIDDGIWSIHFTHHLLGRFDERTMKIINVPV
jgi:putative transposase